MKKQIISVLLLLLITTGSIFAVDGALIKFDIYQYDSANDRNHLTYSDSAQVMVGKVITGFIGPLSVDLELLAADSVRTHFNTHLVTLGPTANTYSKNFGVEYRLPARIEKIEGKNKSLYTLVITPLSYKDIDSSFCTFDHRVKDNFSVKPTAHTDIYYVPSSLGDFYWGSIKELMEASYRQYKEFLNLNIPGKAHIYISPCPIKSVIWDKRFGTSIDPTRNSAFAVYNKEFNTADPFILNHTVTLRTFGYTTPFLSEGLANYFSFAGFDMKQLVKQNNLIPLEDLLDTYAYLKADAKIADRSSATFTKYLIDAYSLDKFLKLYSQADDLNLKGLFPKLYNKTIKELESEWLHYVDTVSFDPMMFVAFASKAEVMLNYELMHTYNLGLLELASKKEDSIRVFSNLKRSSFFNGNYYEAAEYQKKLINLNSEDAGGWMALGSYEMMNGLYDSCWTHFQKAASLDSTSQMINFNIALFYINKGEPEKARKILVNNFSNEKGSSAQGETRVLLANILQNSDEKANQEKAAVYFKEAANMYQQILQTNSSAPSIYMWLGISFLGLHEYDNAVNYLHIAEFIESRPFYQGMINLWLGKAYIAADEKETAKEYLSNVISIASSVYHQEEAAKLLESLK